VDVWATAATFYYLLTGWPPRDFPRGKDCWQVVLQSDAVPIRRRNPSVPAGLAAVIDQALIDQPAIGFRSAAELKRALEKVL
jgi:serine/threonine-protein kinase